MNDLGGADKWAQAVLRGQHHQLDLSDLDTNHSSHCGQCGTIAAFTLCQNCKEAQ